MNLEVGQLVRLKLRRFEDGMPVVCANVLAEVVIPFGSKNVVDELDACTLRLLEPATEFKIAVGDLYMTDDITVIGTIRGADMIEVKPEQPSIDELRDRVIKAARDFVSFSHRARVHQKRFSEFAVNGDDDPVRYLDLAVGAASELENARIAERELYFAVSVLERSL